MPLATWQHFRAATAQAERACLQAMVFRVAMMQGRKVQGTSAAGAAVFIYS